jgi:hypothetical protein
MFRSAFMILSAVAGAVFTNGSFEAGTPGSVPPGWTVNSFLNAVGVTIQNPQTVGGLNLSSGGVVATFILNSPAGPLSQPDPFLGNVAPLRWPKYGKQAVVVNANSSDSFGHGRNANSLSQVMTIGADDVDAADGKVHIRFAFAPVLENANHTAAQQPYYFIQLTNITRATILYTNFATAPEAGSGPAPPWKSMTASISGGDTEVDYTDWQLVDISPGSPAINVGDEVTLQIIASGCQPGGHTGYVLVDGPAVSPTSPE